MYTVSKGPSKLVAKTRRGLPQNFEKIETMREMNRKLSVNNCTELISVSKPVFQAAKKTISHQTYKTVHHNNNDEISSPQHEELIKYIYESWNMIVAQNPYESLMSSASSSSSESSPPSSPSSSISSNSSHHYYVDPPSPVLSDFKPFDLESWWGRRLFNNITKSL